jgi:alkylhydroperoxidase family enzyme
MARIDVPPGEGSESQRVWGLSPELGAAIGALAAKVGGKGLLLPWRTREAARMRIAQINGCQRSHATVSTRSCTRTSTTPTGATIRRRSASPSSTPTGSPVTTVRSTTRSSCA